MRRRASSQIWTLTRVHRVLRPLRTKVAALATSLKKERHSNVPPNGNAPTPTPTRLRPPLRRTYQTRRKRKRGDGMASEDEDGQYVPKPVRVSKSKSKPSGKPERRWSPEVLERMGAVVDAFRVLADVVYDEQVETEGEGSLALKLRDLCVRTLATDIEPSAVAAAGPTQDDSDDEGELVDVTNLVDQKFEEIPEHLRRAAIIPYALSMIKQHIDTISPLPQLWNHLLAICLSSSASPSAATSADALQICTNLFLAALHQPRSGSRGLASVYRNITGSGPDKISPETFCQTFLAILSPAEQYLEDNYDLPPDFGVPRQLPLRPNRSRIQSPTKTPARRRSFIPPTPPTYDPSVDSDDPTGTLFPIRSFLSRSVAHLVAELGPTELLSFIETASEALLRWVQTDHCATLLRERESVSQRKAGDVRSLAPRLCARIGDWVAIVLADVWSRPIDIRDLERAALALGKIVEVTLGVGTESQSRSSPTSRQSSIERQADKSVWLDVGDPFCALTCVYLAKLNLPKGSTLGDDASKLAALLYRLPLTARNCNVLVGTLSGLPTDGVDVDSPKRGAPRFAFPEPPSPSYVSTSFDPTLSFPLPTYTQALQTYTRALSSANCPHLESTLLQLIVNERPYVETDIEEMLEDAEARWDQLDPSDPLQIESGDEGGGWKWARWKWRWDEITNTWVERNKAVAFGEYIPPPRHSRQPKPKQKGAKQRNARPTEVIAVSSDTEAGWREQQSESDQEEDNDSDDVFAAIPTPKYSNRHLQRSPIKTRRQSLGLNPASVRVRATTVSSDGDDEYQHSTSRTRRNATRRARPMATFDWDESDSSETEKSSESGSEEDESDFDWTQYNGQYNPHDRLPGLGAANTNRPSNRLSTRNSRRDNSDQENRVVQKPTKPSNRVVSDPAPKRQRLVVELPLRPTNRLFSKPPVLGSHNASRRVEPVIMLPPKRSDNAVREITTSTLERLCSQFTQLSSDDDRDVIVDDSQDEEEEDEEIVAEPSSDDMDLFQVVTPAPRRIRPSTGTLGVRARG